MLRPAFLYGQVEFAAYVYTSDVQDSEYLALVLGDLQKAQTQPFLVRVQSMCPLGDVFGSQSCDCEWQLRQSLRLITQAESGVFLYVVPRGRASVLGAFEKHVLQKTPSSEGALRDFGLGAQVLADLGLREIELLTNNPKKISGLKGFGIAVKKRVPIEADVTGDNQEFLRRRREREGHLLSVVANKDK